MYRPRSMLWGFLIAVLTGVSSSNELPPEPGLACDSPIYCHGAVLDTIQRAGIYEDSKTFVDMKMLYDPDDVEQAFEELHNSSDKENLKTFVDRYFSAPGDELDQWKPPDWTDKPPLYYKLEDPELQQFVLDINAIWKDLGRQINKSEVTEHPDRHSLIYVPNPFIIPGDRFREYYYWDSYWIVNGLLVSNMTDTARGMIENFLYLTERFGYVPNGGRVYYSRRSQPPLLTPMVNTLYEVTKDTQFLKLHVTTLEKEYLFWKQGRSVNVTQSATGETYELSRYDADLRTPRPESYREDLKLADCSSKEGKDAIYSNVASACESGLDFSSRWLAQDLLCTLKTPYIIPVDLNVYLCWTEQLLAKFFTVLGDDDKSALYESHADKRWAAIQEVLWSEEEGVWFDLDMQTMKHRKGFYPSNIFPLMMMSEGRNLNDGVIDKVYRYVERHNLLQYDGGVPASLVESGQQWDLPNAWPPLVHLFIESLSSSGHADARDLACDLAVKWLESNAEGYKKHGQMFEKYDANQKGEPGGGGEYSVQKGFGWTNGVALLLLNNYAGSLEQKDTPVGEQDGVPAYTTAAAGVAVGVVLLVAILILLAWFVYKRNTQKRQRESEAMKYNSVKQAEDDITP